MPCSVFYPTRWPPPMIDKWRWWRCSTCPQHSTVSITSCSYADCSTTSDHRRRATLDDVVCFRSDATGFLQRSAVVHSSSTVRSSTEVRSRPPPLRPVHCRLEQGHSQSWSAAAPVRGRLSGLCDDIGRWRCAGCRSPSRMCCRCGCMDELKPATS